MTSVRTIAAVSTSTIAASLVGYCFYFDYKRRNDPEFRKALVKEHKKVEKVKEVQSAKAKQAEALKLDEAISSLKGDNFIPNTPQESEAFFLENVSAGETLAAQGPDFYVDAAVCLIKALRVYPQPTDLLVIYQKTQPAEVMNLITTIFAKLQTGTVRPGSGPGPAAQLNAVETGAEEHGHQDQRSLSQTGSDRSSSGSGVIVDKP